MTTSDPRAEQRDENPDERRGLGKRILDAVLGDPHEQRPGDPHEQRPGDPHEQRPGGPADDRADARQSDARPSDARPSDARPTDDGRAADADGVAPGRHALRDDEPGATGTADPKGTHNPRTEEHTR